MKRDLNYVRDLLLDLEGVDNDTLRFNSIDLDTSDREAAHIELMADAGLVVDMGHRTYRLSWYGYEYLDAVRDKDIWQRTQKSVASIGGATFGMVKDIAIAYLKQRAAEELGIKL